MRRRAFAGLIVALLGAAGPLHAQTGRIVGTVTAQTDGHPLAGAAVTVVGTATGAVTRQDGTYTMEVAPGVYQLRASLVGHQAATQQVTVTNGGTTTANFQLMPTAIALQGLVVVGYGQEKARELTGSVKQLSEGEFNPGRVVSPEQLIKGKIAGVQIIDSGEPGGGMNIRIRGGTSVNASNEPLFVVDGVPLPFGGGLSAGRDPLNFLNPQDIKSITVLKDAASTAIYGSRGANGVVLIETKTGATGPQISYSGSYSTSRITRQPEMLSAGQLRTAVQSYAPDMAQYLGSAQTDWQSAIERAASGQEHTVAISGAGDGNSYRLSLNYLDQDGVLKGSNTQRIATGLSYNQNLLGDRLRVTANLHGARTRDQFTPAAVLGNAIVFDPTQPILDPTSPTGYFEETNFTLGPNNPVAELAYAQESGTTYRSVGNVEGRYQFPFLEGLSGTLRLGYDVAKSEKADFYPAIMQSQVESPVSCSTPPCPSGTVDRSNPTEVTGVLDGFLNYNHAFDRFQSNLDATAGYSYEKFRGDHPYFKARGLSTDLLGPNGVPAAVQNTSTLTVDESKLASFFGRINYSLMDRYLLMLSVRRDGSSKFGPGHQWGTFPAAGIGWRISSEPFMQGVDWLSNLKLRASWGVNGNQAIGDYLWLANYTYSDAYARPQFGDEFVTTIRPSAVDPNIQWEQTTSYDLGIDYGLFGERLSGSVDYYRKDTDHLLFNIPVAAGSYVSNYVTTNVGSVRNQGVEFGLDALLFDGDGQRNGLRWDAQFNASRNFNKLLKIAGDRVNQIPTGQITGGTGNHIQVLMPGNPINSFFVYEHRTDASGKPVATGDLMDMYVDRNGDGVINEGDLAPFHSPQPDWILGHTSDLGYRNFDLGFTLRAYLGNYVYNNLASAQGAYEVLTQAGGITNLQSSVLDYGFEQRQFLSDLYVEDASFLRMDNLTLGYTIPNFRGVSQLRVSGTVQNVFTLTGYDGVDPTAGLNGIDYTLYPLARTFTLGVNVGF